MVGTDGDDVIVGLAGDDSVSSKGGNDTVCGHAGADLIWDTSGDDVILGGDGSDDVWAGNGHDIVRLGGGKDYFSSYGDVGPIDLWLGPGDEELSLSLPVGGAVHAGPGDDELRVSTIPHVPLTLVGGDGQDLLQLMVDDSLGNVPVLISPRTAVMRLGHGALGRVTGWNSFGLWGGHTWQFRGTNSVDQVLANEGHLRAHLYGGDDLAQVIGPGPHYIDAGSGFDYVDAHPWDATCISAEWGTCSPNSPR